MNVDSIDDLRFSVAIELLREGHSMTFRGIDFWIDRETEILQIRILIESANRLTDEKAGELLRSGIDVFEYLKANSSTFSAIVENLMPRCSFVFDYGSGSVEVGYFLNGALTWN